MMVKYIELYIVALNLVFYQPEAQIRLLCFFNGILSLQQNERFIWVKVEYYNFPILLFRDQVAAPIYSTQVQVIICSVKNYINITLTYMIMIQWQILLGQDVDGSNKILYRIKLFFLFKSLTPFVYFWIVICLQLFLYPYLVHTQSIHKNITVLFQNFSWIFQVYLDHIDILKKHHVRSTNRSVPIVCSQGLVLHSFNVDDQDLWSFKEFMFTQFSQGHGRNLHSPRAPVFFLKLLVQLLVDCRDAVIRSRFVQSHDAFFQADGNIQIDRLWPLKVKGFLPCRARLDCQAHPAPSIQVHGVAEDEGVIAAKLYIEAVINIMEHLAVELLLLILLVADNKELSAIDKSQSTQDQTYKFEAYAHERSKFIQVKIIKQMGLFIQTVERLGSTTIGN